MEQPIRLTASLRERVWGKTRLAPWFPDSETAIGEAWFLSPRELPLLVKLIFTQERLSVQVHPDDGESGRRGKTEMWHILEAEPGATIAMGFREPITREHLWEATRTGEVEHLLRWAPVLAGETYLIPAHTVHAIGAGIVLCEAEFGRDVPAVGLRAAARDPRAEGGANLRSGRASGGVARRTGGRRAPGSGAFEALRNGVGAAAGGRGVRA
jgi:hypothetical protein